MLPRMVATASLDGREVDARAERERRCAGWRAGRDFFPAWPPRPASRPFSRDFSPVSDFG